ncbi:MAG: SDR family NAD(P)-dependent oxidoreductase [Pseudomonadota bacterium]
MNRIVIITGASSGIGAALAREFARRGYDVGLMARRADRLDELAQELRQGGTRVETGIVDVARDETVHAAVDALREKLGGLDVFVANAGITAINRTGAGDISKDKAVFAVNLIGAIASLDAAAKYFRAQKKGTLVGISSIAALTPIPGSGSYSASKAALSSWLRAARAELKKHGIAVTAIHPGFIRTELVPEMEKFPFVIDAEPAARAMVDAIEKKKASVIVPSWPWKPLLAIGNLLPESLAPKLF